MYDATCSPQLPRLELSARFGIRSAPEEVTHAKRALESYRKPWRILEGPRETWRGLDGILEELWGTRESHTEPQRVLESLGEQ